MTERTIEYVFESTGGMPGQAPSGRLRDPMMPRVEPGPKPDGLTEEAAANADLALQELDQFAINAASDLANLLGRTIFCAGNA